MNLQQLLIIFSARKNLIIAYLLVTMLATLVLSLSTPKQYVANTSLVLDQPSINPITGAELRIQLTAGYMATQTDIIKSPSVALLVSNILNLTSNKDYQESFRKSSDLNLEKYELLQAALREGDGQLKGSEQVISLKHELMEDFRNWIAGGLIKGLEVIPSRESNILGISFSATSAKFAAKAADAYAQAYIQISNQLKRQSTQQTADWFEDQSRLYKERLEKAQQQLSSFQQKYGIIASSSEERVDLEEAKLAELSNQLIRSQLETADLVSKKEQLTKGLANMESLKSLSEVLSSPVLQQLKIDLVRTDAKLADLRQTIGINHPRYKQTVAEANDLKEKIKTEMNTVMHGFNSRILSAKQRDGNLVKVVAEQKARVLELKKYYDEIAVLKREVANAKVIYDEVTKRAIQMRMESEIRQSNAAVLDHAVAPKVADKPKIKINMILSVFLGLILGLGAALFAEILDRRVRSQTDIVDGLDLPVFGVIVTNKPTKKFFGVGS
ncbi:Tyrosine-protein kinase ptk [Patescibacteria group bacterium]|nr:Tyrosine-protein kinase ptk [Patescibacteria group bacterium]